MWSNGGGGDGVSEAVKHQTQANQSSGVWKYSQTPPAKIFQWVAIMEPLKQRTLASRRLPRCQIPSQRWEEIHFADGAYMFYITYESFYVLLVLAETVQMFIGMQNSIRCRGSKYDSVSWKDSWPWSWRLKNWNGSGVGEWVGGDVDF